jgi:hypothetical protein
MFTLHILYMSSRCFDIGMSGNCGYTCEVFREGECIEHQTMMLINLLKYDYDEAINILDDSYPNVIDEFNQIIRIAKINKLNQIINEYQRT